MDPVEHILKDYRKAGEEHRLDLFLSYRDLRDKFREIEREEASTGSLRESPAFDDRYLRRYLPAWVRCC
ncbi:MAG: hypothetical protein HKM29_00470 [Deltaproteobacteria bacterium]|nr:hypothetical protein [Deltaproteobacteria bacterium]NNG46651.1 hypothetical protein [Deltaproteobacteria bacterium]